MHVPITLGGRLFGVLTATHEVPGRFGEDDLRRLAALGVGAAGAIAHALEFEHERRIARALTAGFVPGPPDPQTGLELGLVYEPVAHEVGGGDVFGVWTLPSGAVAVLIGDVSGKGLEVAAASAMVRFFVEARAWDTESPGRGARADQPDPAHAPAPRRLRHRLPRRRRRRPAALLQRRPPAAVPAAGGRRVASRCPAAGCRSASRTTGGTRSARSRSSSATSSSPPPTGCSRCGASGASSATTRLPELLVGARAHDAAAAVRRARVRRRAGVGAGAARRRRRARAAARARARAARRAGEQPGRAGALRGVPGARARAAGGRSSSRPTTIFATERAFEEERAASSSSTRAGIPVACGGYRSLGPELAEIKRMFVTADARRQGHARRVLAELERRCRGGRARAASACSAPRC